MVLESKNTTIAYRCPVCGAGVMSMVGVFSLSANMFKLKCSCGGSHMDINVQSDGNIRLTVPCVFCPNPHVFTVSRSLFFGRDIFLLPCPIYGIDISFIGHEEDVSAELERTEAELREMLEANGISDINALLGDVNEDEEDDDPLSDPQIYDIVMFVIKDLQEAGDIRCSCGNGPYSIDIFDDCIRVTCDECGDFEDVPTDSTIAANAFLHADHLELTNHKEENN